MHEMSIVLHIAKSVEKVAVENKVDKVTRVTLQIGEVSTIVPDYLTECWKIYCNDISVLAGASLEVEVVPAITSCNSCGRTFPTVANGKTCPFCASEATHLMQGDEHYIKEIEVESED